MKSKLKLIINITTKEIKNKYSQNKDSVNYYALRKQKFYKNLTLDEIQTMKAKLEKNYFYIDRALYLTDHILKNESLSLSKTKIKDIANMRIRKEAILITIDDLSSEINRLNKNIDLLVSLTTNEIKNQCSMRASLAKNKREQIDKIYMTIKNENLTNYVNMLQLRSKAISDDLSYENMVLKAHTALTEKEIISIANKRFEKLAIQKVLNNFNNMINKSEAKCDLIKD